MTARADRRFEWPTAFVAAAIYGLWIAVTWFHADLHPLVLGAVGAWLIAWHGSLQHETIHGHPTRWQRVNDAIGAVPLSLWLPYDAYRRTHIEHHRSPAITDPLSDPESRYLPRGVPIRSLFARLQASLAGRLLFGPAIAIVTFLTGELRRLGAEPVLVVREWVPHLAGVALVIIWLRWCDLDLTSYALLFVYPGTALTLLRSFAEHRADFSTTGRAASVEAAGPLAILFLNNQYHAAHHDRPDLAWYRLPAHHRHDRARLTDEGRAAYRGYGEIVRRFWRRRHDSIVHPEHAGSPL